MSAITPTQEPANIDSNHQTGTPYATGSLEEDDSAYDDVDDTMLSYLSGRDMRNPRPLGTGLRAPDGSVVRFYAKKGV